MIARPLWTIGLMAATIFAIGTPLKAGLLAAPSLGNESFLWNLPNLSISGRTYSDAAFGVYERPLLAALRLSPLDSPPWLYNFVTQPSDDDDSNGTTNPVVLPPAPPPFGGVLNPGSGTQTTNNNSPVDRGPGSQASAGVSSNGSNLPGGPFTTPPDTSAAVDTPEPDVAAMIGIGLLAIGLIVRRQRSPHT